MYWVEGGSDQEREKCYCRRLAMCRDAEDYAPLAACSVFQHSGGSD